MARQGSLQAIVIGAANVGNPVNESQKGELGAIGARSGSRIDLVDIGNGDQS